MSLNFRLFFFFNLLFTSLVIIAQDTTAISSGDTKYREDQFYIGATYNLLSNVPSGVKIRGLSGGIQFGYLRDMPINEKRTFAIAIGAGFGFNEYGQNLFIGEVEGEKSTFTVLNDEDFNYNRNRFSISTIDLPIELRWRASTPETYKFWRVYAGFRVGYAYWYKATFKQTGNNVNQTNIPEFDRLRLGTTLSFGYNTFNFFAYYGLNPFFKGAVTTSGEEVNFQSIRVGLMFYIL
ncbi:porin family protein [Ulvibacter antarcticus]|uniref:Uncharacterized protein n=1 Tax=Ulvibacter antarcticus TaxID=442714 RepID=A0A3L9Z4B6_9FLAO|nr:porin family protein [Ulvibacter antarcticus]RMA66279.1 hypothetical protein BXY75_0700 [Ulvibacter antarcticus]